MIKNISVYACFALLGLLAVSSCNTEDENQPASSNSNRDVPDLYLPDGLEATLWAESPLFYNPTNMDVDIKGRIWVTEAVNYRTYVNDSATNLHHSQGDRVMILEDTNHDGRADISKLYVQDKDLISPVGIAVIGNKIIVSCSPNLIVFTDVDGDDKPDKKEIILTGFGGKDHDHSLHAVFAAPDGNWIFNTGNAGPHVVTDNSGWTLRSGSIYTGGSPYNNKNGGNMKSDDGKVWVGGLALRVNPDGKNLKVMAHNFRNSYEVFPDSYGNLWQNDNDDQVVTCRTSWVMEGGNAGYFSTDGTRYWQADQRPGQDIFNAHWHQEDPGVMPAGDRSGSGAPTGVALNESDALGSEYRGLLLSADAGRNVVFGYHPTLKQSGFDLGKRSAFIRSSADDSDGYVWNDTAQNSKREKWFRPSDVMIGTDGAIYVADWFDPVVGGHQMDDSLGYGRIYRITPKNKKLNSPTIDINTTEGQIQAFKSAAINVRNEGFLKLKQQGELGVDILGPLLSDANPYIKARTIWLLAQLGQKGREKVEELLNDPDQQMRATAYRALRGVVPDLLPYARKMSSDKSSFVRREVAVSLRDLPFGKTKDILLELIRQYDGEDRWYLETLGSAIEGHESMMYPLIKTTLAEGKTPHDWNRQMADFAWRLHPEEAVPDLVTRASDDALSENERQRSLTALAFINRKAAVNAMVTLSHSPIATVAETAKYWLAFRQSNNWYKLYNWNKLNINTAYERKLAEMKALEAIVLDEKQAIDERRHRVYLMAKDSVGGQMLINLAAEKKLIPVLVEVAVDNIFDNPNPAVRVQAGDHFERPGSVSKYSITDINNLKGDAVQGKAIYAMRCASCHKLNNEGGTIGPDLTGIGKKFGDTELLDAIINPSAAIVFGYESILIKTVDGGSLYGFLISENQNTLVIKDIAGKQQMVDVKNIASREKQKKSLMPDAGNNGLSEQDLANIVSFLKSRK